MSTQEKFDLAVKIVQSLPKDGPIVPDDSLKLKCYGYFKQAKIGKCNTAQPWMVQVTERAKWDAWNALGDMSGEEAKLRYAQEFYQSLDGKSRDGASAELTALL